MLTASEEGKYVCFGVTPVASTGASPGTEVMAVTASAVPDSTAPILSEVTAVTTPTNDNTPSYVFSSDEAGTIGYGSGCESTSNPTAATAGNNTVTFSSLGDGTYSGCTINVTDAADNESNSLTINDFTVDTAAPSITITNPSTSAAISKTLTASASDGTLKMSETTGTTCDNTLTFVTYASKTYSTEAGNGKKLCYQAVDTAGNEAYSLSDAIAGIDATAPTISITNPNTSAAISKTITASASDGTLSMSNTTGAVCNGTLSFITYASQTFVAESDNGTKVCYKAADSLGNTAYSLSNALAGIDTTAPIIAIANPNTNAATSKTLTASASDGVLTMSETTGTTCDGSLTFVAYASKTYTAEADNGKKLCYRAVDTLGNTAYGPSNAIAGIDTTAPTVTLNKADGQSALATVGPINFTVIFSETTTNFAAGDVTLSSSTTPGTLTATVTGSGTTYNVAVSGMTDAGTVIASIAAATATDAAGNSNIASTSSTIGGNEVTYNPPASVVVTGTPIASEDGGTPDSYDLALSRSPSSGSVTVSITTPDSQCTVSPTSVTLSSTTASTITVTAFNDTTPEGAHTCVIKHAITASSDTTNFPLALPIADMTVAMTDNDPGVVISQSGGTTAVTEGGTTGDTYTVALATLPDSSVTVSVTPNTQVEATPASLTFTTGNWSTAQTVTVTAKDDTTVEGNHSGSVAHAITTGDGADYLTTATVPSVSVNITDNDNPPPPPAPVYYPEIQLLDNTTDIADNTGKLDFGTTSVGTPVVKTLTVKNTGRATLTLGTPTLSTGFSVANFPTSIAAGKSVQFTLSLDATQAATLSGQFSVTNNDGNENPFNFTLQGVVQGASTGKPLAFYLPGGNYSGSAFLRITNDTNNPVSVKGTLYDANGAVIGNANALLTPLAAQQTVALSMPALATAVGSGWNELAWLALSEPSSGITVMNTYRNENGALTNMTSVSENAAYLLPGSVNQDAARLVLVNTSAVPVEVVGSLYHQDGYLLGQAHSVLVNALPARALRVLSPRDLEQLTGTGAWTGRAWLSLQPVSGLVMMNVVVDTSAVVSNFTSARADGNYNIPSSNGTDKGYTRFTNTTDAPLPLYATLYHLNGAVLGTPSRLLSTLPARSTRVLGSSDLERLFGVRPWAGRSRLALTAPNGAVQVIGTIRSPTLRSSALVSASEMDSSKLYNLPPSNSTQDVAYARITNTSSQAVTVIGTLYSQDGSVLGNAHAVLIPTLQPGETQVLDMLTLQRRSGSNQPWTQRARLVISEPTSGIQLMGMIRSKQSNILTNMSAVRTIQ